MGLYIQMHSMHGLFRSTNIELGRDEDTGGQIVYVLELAKALGKLKEVDRVDIITRRIVDPEYPGYSKTEEKVTRNVSIIRVDCGPEHYLKKVDLWPYLDEFIGNTIKYIKKIKRTPDIFQSNYADSGLVCAKLSEKYGVPQVHTGHSLGIPKMERLGVTKSNMKTFNKMFHFDKRIHAENIAIGNSKAIITSTREEIREQYQKYDVSKAMHKFHVAAPGIDIDRFHPTTLKNKNDKTEQKTRAILNNIMDQHTKYPERTTVSILTRLDKRKNIIGLLKAFAKDKEFQSMANLLIFAQTLDGDSEAQKVIKKMDKIIRRYNLYENIAIPGYRLEHDKQVPAYYRWLKSNEGIFVNPALIEPFGLTVLEASACGVPVVATKQGGPSEIITHGLDGLLIDPKDPKDIAKKIKLLIKHKDLYNLISKNAIKMVKQKYTWNATAKKYLDVFNHVTRQ